MDYKKAGVDIEAGYRSVELMKELCARRCWEAWEDSQEHFLLQRLKRWKSRCSYPEQMDVEQK